MTRKEMFESLKADVAYIEKQMTVGAVEDLEGAQAAAGRIAFHGQMIVAIGEEEMGASYRGPTMNGDTVHDALSFGKAVLAKLPKSTDRITPPRQPGGSAPHNFERKPMGTITNARPNSYAAIFGLEGKTLEPTPFQSAGQFMSHFVKAVQGHGMSPILAAHGEGSYSEGGFLVPPQFLVADLDPPVEAEIVFPRADVYPMTSESLSINGVENSDNTDGQVFGGFTAEWVPEHGTFSEQTLKTRKVVLTRKKLGVFCTASNELIEDSDFQQKLIPSMRTAIADARDYAFLRGTGAGQPRGILNDPAKITVAKESGQAAATIKWENCVKMYARLHPRLVNNAVWLANPDTLPQLLMMTITIGTGGESRAAVMESSGGLTLLNRPILFTSKLPTLGTEGDLMLCDISQYAIGQGPDVSVAASNDAKFQQDQVCFRAKLRADGQGKWKEAFTPRNGASLSWVVTLATRS